MNSKRYVRIRQVIAMRQPDLTVYLENVHKPAHSQSKRNKPIKRYAAIR